ncbi:MAG: hypothetical protein ACKOXB_02705 [Flavobacteriales bacterium]
MHKRNSHIIIFFLLFFIVVQKGYSQKALNTKIVEERSYALYLTAKWDDLIAYGDSVMPLGFDYYYIRMRVGIAYYELKKYRLAEEHFKKAIEFNASEDLPFEYLYYIYLYSGRYEESRMLSKTFSATLKAKLSIDDLPKVDAVSLDAGRKITNITDVPSAMIIQLGLNHYVANRFSLYHSYTFYAQGNTSWRVNQNQYYLGAVVPLKKNWTALGSFHFVQGRTDFLTTGVGPQPSVSYSASAYNYVGSLTLKKNLKHFDVSIGSSALWLDSVAQFQHHTGLTYYPLGNNKLALGAQVYMHTRDNYSNINFAVTPYVSYRVSARLGLHASYLSNSGNNLAEWNGFLFNNSPDLTTSRFTVGAEYSINKHFDIGATYQFENKTSAFGLGNYNFNSIIIAFKYKP